MTLSPELRALRGRLGAYAQHAKHDARSTTARARETFLKDFDRQVDPEGVLEPAERERRATAARKAHFARLAMRSAAARQKNSARGKKSTSAGSSKTAGAREEAGNALRPSG